MTEVKLTDVEQSYYDTLSLNVERLKDNRYTSRNVPQDQEINRKQALQIIEENAHICVKLHNSLKNRGIPPIHSKYMIRNRETLTSDSFEFYNHFHPQEDLLKFIQNPNTNKLGMAPDVTMGEEFDLKIYTRRWGHYDPYKCKRNADGWHISFFVIEGQCDKGGDPYLYKNLDQDCVSYSKKDIKSLLSSIWTRAENGASKQKVQEYLNKVAEYIRTCEENYPEDIDV